MSLMDHLLTLYRVDSQVRALRTRVDGGERDFAAQAKLFAQLQRQETELASQARQLQATIHNLEVEAQGFGDRVAKLRSELNNSQNDKQYKALLTEVKLLEGKKKDCDDRAFAEMERLEQVKKQAAGVAVQFAERKKILDVVKAQLEERKHECADRLAELERERAVASGRVPERERKIFDKVADDCEGEVMAEIEEIDRRHKEYACSSCRMEIPFASVATLMSNVNILVQCTACTRILYLAEQTKEVLRK
jgi:predicted  nucleic acid-binding Zn-ribbon protein